MIDLGICDVFVALHVIVIFGLLLVWTIILLVAKARVLEYLTCLLVLVEDRLCGRVVNSQIVCGSPNGVRLED